MIAQGQSWFASRDVERIATHTTPAAVAAAQVKRLAATMALSFGAVIVADSHYAKRLFLTVFTGFPNVFVLVRLACNRVLYGPPPVITGSRPKGRPRVHGAKFKLKAPPPESQTTVTVGQVTQVKMTTPHDPRYNHFWCDHCHKSLEYHERTEAYRDGTWGEYRVWTCNTCHIEVKPETGGEARL